MIFSTLAAFPGRVPVDPDSQQARQWLVDELAKPAYRQAEPTLFDRISEAVQKWFESLNLTVNGITQGPILVIASILLFAVLLAAFLVFGRPRLNRRSAASRTLFGESDVRDAAALRRAAATAAAAGDWPTAVAEQFRAIARGLDERTILSASPGTTARGFAVAAGRVLPEFEERLVAASVAFDDVRYLGGVGSEESYTALATLDTALQSARPLALASPQLAGAPR